MDDAKIELMPAEKKTHAERPYHNAETEKIAHEREAALNTATDGAETDGKAE